MSNSNNDERIPLKYRLNMCDIDRYAVLAPIGDAVAKLWQLLTYGTDCPCCLGTRFIGALVAAAGVGAWIGSL